MLKRAALVAVAVFGVGCGSAEEASGPEPVERHLVYQKLIGETGIWIADADGGRPRLLVRDGIAPVISPDGKWVAYVRERRGLAYGDLYLVPTLGGKPRLLAERADVWHEWSPTSDRIVAARDEEGYGESLISIDVAGDAEVTMARGLFGGTSFSPDGKQFVFAVAPADSPVGTEQYDLFITDTDGSDKKRIMSNGPGGSIAWGPESIAFSDSGSGEIWRMQADGTGRSTITGSLPKRFLGEEDDFALSPIDWSEDGRALLAAWVNDWGAPPVAVDPESGKISELGPWPQKLVWAVELSRDGRFALVQLGEGAHAPPEASRILIVPYAGGDPLLDLRGAASPSWNR